MARIAHKWPARFSSDRGADFLRIICGIIPHVVPYRFLIYPQKFCRLPLGNA
jgi:hypothetical protein